MPLFGTTKRPRSTKPFIISAEFEHPVGIFFPDAVASNHFRQTTQRLAEHYRRGGGSYEYGIYLFEDHVLANMICRASGRIIGKPFPPHTNAAIDLTVETLPDKSQFFLPKANEFSGGYALPDGSRLYVDHGHVEYAAGEQRRIHDLLAAHEHFLSFVKQCIPFAVADWIDQAIDFKREGSPLFDFFSEDELRTADMKMFFPGSDRYGHSQGMHLNNLVPNESRSGGSSRDLLMRHLPGFQVAMALISGAGKVGVDAPAIAYGEQIKIPEAASMVFQRTERADFVLKTFGTDTQRRRSLVDLRDEPHGGSGSYRVHSINYDYSPSHEQRFLTYFLHGMACRAITDEFRGFPVFDLGNPVSAVHAASRSPRPTVTYNGGKTIHVIDMLSRYVEAIENYANKADVTFDSDEVEIGLELARASVEGLTTDWTRCHHLADVAKWHTLKEIAAKKGLPLEFDASQRVIRSTNGDPQDLRTVMGLDIGFRRAIDNSARDLWTSKIRHHVNDPIEVPEVKAEPTDDWLMSETRSGVRGKNVSLMLRDFEGNDSELTSVAWRDMVVRDGNQFWKVALPEDLSPEVARRAIASKTAGELVGVLSTAGIAVDEMRRNLQNKLEVITLDEVGIA